jgi:pilus assembly protein CpaF
MVLLAGIALPIRAIREDISSALDMTVHLTRLSDGTRKVVKVTEVTGMEEDVVTTQDIFVFERQGVDEQGRVRGFHRATGVRPKFSERLLQAGISLGPELFDPSRRQAAR